MAFYEGEEYRETGFPNWQGNVFVGSLKFKKLIRLEIQKNKVVSSEDLLKKSYGRIRDLEIAKGGSIFLLTDEKTGELVHMKPL